MFDKIPKNQSSDVRPALFANQFYPGDSKILKQNILRYLEKAETVPVDGKLKALISPHAGYIYSGYTAAYSYKLLKNLDKDTEWKILLLGPSHQVSYSGAAVSEQTGWQTPLGMVKVKDIREEIGEKDDIVDIPEANMHEHSLEVQVLFLQSVLKKFVLYPLVLGSIRPDFLADDLLDFCREDDVIVLVSSDLSHYLRYEEAKKIDLATSEAICGLDIEKMTERGDACGRMGILTAMFIANKLGWKCKMLNYTNSGDTAGDKNRVVGYGAYAFYL